MLKTAAAQKPELKTPAEIAMMRESGKIVAEALRAARGLALPGARTSEIDRAIELIYQKHDVMPLFKGYPGKVPFPASTCISVNEQLVHGVPGSRVLRSGDLLKVDTACKRQGWCADAAVCFPIGDVSAEVRRLVQVAEEALQIAIRECGRKQWWFEVAVAMQQHVEKAGFSVVEKFVGHGIGRVMHEAPQVPNYRDRDFKKHHNFRLQPGLVLAIEPMVNMGRKDVLELPDQWTVITRDRLPSAHVEHTIAITDHGVEVLTADS
jgi:methionyl aminopeptidase